MSEAMHEEALSVVRSTVRKLLEKSPAYARVGPQQRRAVAQRMVDVSMIAAKLIQEDLRLTGEIEARKPIATAQSAGDQLGMQATRAASDTFARVRDSIDFPTYVTSLISGVFQAILSSSTHQIGTLGDLLDNVSATSDEFEKTISDEEATRWALARFSFLSAGSSGLALRPNTDLVALSGQLKQGLDASESEVSSIDESDLSGTLLPLVRRKVGRSKQAVLASMVQMGLQRIVVDEGRLSTSMDMRVDASSISRERKAEEMDYRVNAGASGSFGVGPWAASAQVSTSIGQVKSDQQDTAEQIAVRAGLRSSVELAFRTEQVPLDRLADEKARVKIGEHARVPIDVSTGTGLLPADPFSGMAAAPLAPSVAPAAPPLPAKSNAPGAPAAKGQTQPKKTAAKGATQAKTGGAKSKTLPATKTPADKQLRAGGGDGAERRAAGAPEELPYSAPLDAEAPNAKGADAGAGVQP